MTPDMSAASVLLVAFLSAWLATRVLVRVLGRTGMLDVPNARSSHGAPTPRGGGLGILAGVAAGLICASLFATDFGAVGSLLCGALLVAACGLRDDWKPCPAPVRLAAHVIAASLVIAGAGTVERLPLPPPADLELGPAGMPVAILWIVGVANIYNFLDGIDGFAGLQGGIAGLAIAFMRFDSCSQALGLAIAGGCLGFLAHNWHPARIFMGDVGSTTIGFLLAAMSLGIAPGKRVPAVFSVAMCLWFFLADGAFTLLRRLLRGERVWAPHRSHLYQQLVLSGLPHNAVASRIGAVAALLAVLAVVAARSDSPGLCWGVLTVAITSFLGYLRWVRQRRASRPSSYPGMAGVCTKLPARFHA